MGSVSLSFLFLFLPAVFAVFRLLKPRYANLWLLIAGLACYSMAAPGALLVLLTVILISYLAGAANGKIRSINGKRILSGICIALLTGLLILFRTEQMTGTVLTEIPGLEVLAPLGVFFYTLQAVMYIADTCKGEPCLFNPIDLALYISFFPRLASGPLEPYRQFRERLGTEFRTQGAETLADGVWRIAAGLCKKVLIADQLSGLVGTVFGTGGPGSLSVMQTWLGVIAYALQLYIDFSACTDIAIGAGKLFGYELPENFRYPYAAGSLKEFWRRWHISLSRFFRDYVYIPLGGNRKGKARWILSLMTVWMLTGLWHGFTLNYVIWGLGHGVLLAAETLLRKKEWQRKGKIFGHLYTLFFVILLWIVFRAQDLSAAKAILLRLLGAGKVPFADTGFLFQLKNALVPLVLGILLCIPPEFTPIGRWKGKNWYKAAATAILTVGTIASIACMYLNSYQPFLYAMF